jgi:hypothetical protein
VNRESKEKRKMKQKGVQLHRLVIPRSGFNNIPEADQELLVLFAHAFDEMNTFLRLFLWSNPHLPRLHKIEREARTAQGYAIAEVLTGKIYELWELIDRRDSPLRNYQGVMDAKAKTAYKALKDYFEKTNLIQKVRTYFAFHYLQDKKGNLREAISKESGNDFVIYLCSDMRNTFFNSADAIVHNAMLSSIDADDREKAAERLQEETVRVTRWLRTIIEWFVFTLIRKYCNTVRMKGTQAVHIENTPKDQNIRIPYFVIPSQAMNIEGGA